LQNQAARKTTVENESDSLAFEQLPCEGASLYTEVLDRSARVFGFRRIHTDQSHSLLPVELDGVTIDYP
jgi:hypothetical protein